MAPRSFRFVCGPGPGETVLDEDGPRSIVGGYFSLVLTYEFDNREWKYCSSNKLAKMS